MAELNRAVAVDIDNTLADLVTVTCQLLSQDFGFVVTPRDWQTWGWPNEQWGLTKGQLHKVFDRAWADWINMPLCDATGPQALRRLRKHGWRVLLASHASPQRWAPICAWAEYQHLAIDGVFLARPELPKLALPVSVLIDDRPGLVSEIGAYPNKQVFLVSRPYNRNMPSNPQVVVVRDLMEAADRLC